MYKFKAKGGTEAGLRLWIAFILGLWLAGLRAELCIFLGAMGGLATWLLVSYWKAEKVELKPAPPTEPEPASESRSVIGPLGRVLLTPTERFRRLGVGRRLPRWPERKPPKKL